MVKLIDSELDRTFSALADPTRRAILKQLAGGDRSVGEVNQPLRMSWPAVTKHIKVLEKAGLIKRTKEGRVHRLTLEAQPLEKAVGWMENYQQFWEDNLDRLAHYVEQKTDTKPKVRKK